MTLNWIAKPLPMRAWTRLSKRLYDHSKQASV